MNGNYRFLVRGHLDDRWSEWLGGLTIERTDDGRSVLTGAIADQAALHGTIGRIRDLGLPLLAVESVGEGGGERVRRLQPGARGSPVTRGSGHEQADLTDDESDRSTDFPGDTPCG